MPSQKVNSLTRDTFDSPLRMLLMGEAEPPTSSRSSTLRDTLSTPHMAQAIARMAESGRAKVKENRSYFRQLLARHSELEQSETKAQAALVTILTLTQITELKLLLDIGRQGHRFYDFVLTMLIACLSLEIFVGIIIIYIGNLHYYQTSEKGNGCHCLLHCLTCCCRQYRRYGAANKSSTYMSVRASGTSQALQRTPGPEADENAGCCDFTTSTMENIIDLERADSNIEVARVKCADAEVKIVRAGNYLKVVEEALKKTPGNADLEEELGKAREELRAAMQEKEEAEAEQKLAEAQQHHAFFVKEQYEDKQERLAFRKVSFWQHMATYLLYFVMLMNVFVTTFGISGGRHDGVFATTNGTKIPQ